MRKMLGFTTIELLIGITLLAIVTGGILGLLVTVQHFFKDAKALVDSHAVARTVVEEMTRWDVREGKSFVVSLDGNTLTLTKYDGTNVIFGFNNGDGSDDTFSDNTIQKDGITIGKNIIKIPDKPIFEGLTANELIAINFGVRNKGMGDRNNDVHISTAVGLRN